MNIVNKVYKKIIYPIYQAKEREIDISDVKKFLGSLPEPTDNIDKSYNKYLCKYHYYSGVKKFLIKTISAIALIPAAFLIKLPIVGNAQEIFNGKLVIEELEHLDYRDIIPDALYEQYATVVVELFSNKLYGRLMQDAKDIYYNCKKRYPRNYAFLFLVYKELAKHSYLIKKHNPEALTEYAAERNIAGPVVTELYEKQGRKFISFMHGDYLLQLIQAYMQYTEYYTWDPDYSKLFVEELKCDGGQFIEYTPQKLRKKYDFDGSKPEYVATYYFSNEGEETIQKLHYYLSKLSSTGINCKVRLHPRATANNKTICELFDDFFIEDPLKVSIEESLRNTEYVIGLSSTVLHEAYVEGKQIIIDDICSVTQYEKLKSKKYIMLNKEHMLFSDFLGLYS